MKHRDLIKKLTAAGYREKRDNGNHTIYVKPGSQTLSIPRHREISEQTAQSILKAAGLI